MIRVQCRINFLTIRQDDFFFTENEIALDDDQVLTHPPRNRRAGRLKTRTIGGRSATDVLNRHAAFEVSFCCKDVDGINDSLQVAIAVSSLFLVIPTNEDLHGMLVNSLRKHWSIKDNDGTEFPQLLKFWRAAPEALLDYAFMRPVDSDDVRQIERSKYAGITFISFIPLITLHLCRLYHLFRHHPPGHLCLPCLPYRL